MKMSQRVPIKELLTSATLIRLLCFFSFKQILLAYFIGFESRIYHSVFVHEYLGMRSANNMRKVFPTSY